MKKCNSYVSGYTRNKQHVYFSEEFVGAGGLVSSKILTLFVNDTELLKKI